MTNHVTVGVEGTEDMVAIEERARKQYEEQMEEKASKLREIFDKFFPEVEGVVYDAENAEVRFTFFNLDITATLWMQTDLRLECAQSDNTWRISSYTHDAMAQLYKAYLKWKSNPKRKTLLDYVSDWRGGR